MKPTNPLVGPMHTDVYQLTMAYAYWKAGRHQDHAVFELFFRKCPFGGEFALFAGLAETLGYVEQFRFTPDDIEYVRNAVVPNADPAFYDWLATLDCSEIMIRAIPEGTAVFPRVPLITVVGPLAIAQLLETTLLNLVNYASLVATNAARMRLAAGPDKTLLEFGLRRAQGPDGALTASRSAYIGGFDTVSTVLAGKLFGIPVRGTHAHSFVTSFTGLDEIKDRTLTGPDSRTHDFVSLVQKYRQLLGYEQTNEGELASFIAYAQAFPRAFLALVDTYDTLRSGVPNFLCIAAALHEIGYRAVGIRLDSGDLAFLSKEARAMFRRVASTPAAIDFSYLKIGASNDLNEAAIHSLNAQGHELDVFGIGTNLVTCEGQPAFGGVYKLVEVNDIPRIKLSQDPGKMTIPGSKRVFRLYGADDAPIVDLLTTRDEPPPERGKRILCLHPSDSTKRVYVTPHRVLELSGYYWNRSPTPAMTGYPDLTNIRDHARVQISNLRPDHTRPLNPTPYKVAVSEQLHARTQQLWEHESPIAEIS